MTGRKEVRMLRSLLLALAAPALLAAPAAVAQDQATSADARLKAIYEAEWTWRAQELALNPEASPDGADRLPHVDAASQERRLVYWTEVLRQLDAIPLDELSPEERINADVLRTSIEGMAIQLRYREYHDPFGFWASLAPRAG